MNILVFCSNPVNGGTARIFYEFVLGLRKAVGKEHKVMACVNQGNTVEIYKNIEHIKYIDVIPMEEACKGLYGGNQVQRAINVCKRCFRYSKIRKDNIKAMMSFIESEEIHTVIIHNGGYVGDDLCNQMLHASYRCAEHMLCRMYVLHSDMEKNICSKLRFLPYDRKISKQSTQIVTVSNYTRNRIAKSSFINKKIHVIYNGISDLRCKSLSEKYSRVKVDRNEFNVLMIGNFQKNKGQEEFIDAAHIISKKKRGVRYTIIGNIYDKEYYNKCINNISKYSLEDMFHIYKGVYDAFEYIELFDVLVVPSLYDESFGLISVEAMIASVPVVAFSCGGIPEVISNNKDGVLVPVRDVDAMAEAILFLNDNPDKRKEMGKNARKAYEKRFSLDAMIIKYMRLMELI